MAICGYVVLPPQLCSTAVFHFFCRDLAIGSSSRIRKSQDAHVHAW